MKKIAILVAICAVSFSAYSQSKVELGVKGGVNFSSLSGDQTGVEYNSRTGFHFGAYGLIKVLNLGIQPEILYSTRGASFDGLNKDFTQDLTYLDFPIMFKLYSVAGLNLQVGPQFSVLLSADGETAVADPAVATRRIGKSDFKDSDVAFVFGAGWEVPFGLSLSARYILGLSDVTASNNSDSKNRMFQLAVGYKLVKLGK